MPTLVEVKRASNPEIRRTIVGQMLEYAAHAAVTWTKDELRRAFEQSSRDQDRDPDQVLGELLGPTKTWTRSRFWGRGCPQPRRETASGCSSSRTGFRNPSSVSSPFLNAQMPEIEVLAVEVKQFRGSQTQTLVPRVLGRTAASPAAGSAPRLTRERFLDDFGSEIQQKAAAQLLDAAKGRRRHV